MRWTLESLEEHLLVGSTLVEGSTLSEAEAAQVLKGRTVAGHPVHEVRELLNYRAAVEWLMEALRGVAYLSVDLVLGFHQRLFSGFGIPAGQLKVHRNFTLRTDGSRHAYLPPHETPEALRRWVEEFNGPPGSSAEEGAARLYARFQDIHPFDDGNGRIGRVLVAYWLHWKFGKGLPFYASDKLAHLRAIEATNLGDFAPLVAFFRERLRDEGA